MDLIRRKHNNILLHVVDIGDRKITIPVAQLGNGSGKTVLITAGLDGDEYAGIEAAYVLIELYSKQKFDGRLIILPIVNIPGFEAGVSWNPLDHKYPKHIFPGKKNGSSTEKLMYWLSDNFVRDVDFWIDLHSGASTEMLEPFVWFWETKNKVINQKAFDCLKKIKSNRIVFQKEKETFTENIAKQNTAYILLESGQLGQRNKKDIKQHIDWVKQILSSFVILGTSRARTPESKSFRNKELSKKFVYRQVREYISQQNGIWSPSVHTTRLQKHKLLGEVRSLDGKILQKVIAKENGIFLWRREAMSCQKGDSLYAYAYDKTSLRGTQ